MVVDLIYSLNNCLLSLLGSNTSWESEDGRLVWAYSLRNTVHHSWGGMANETVMHRLSFPRWEMADRKWGKATNSQDPAWWNTSPKKPPLGVSTTSQMCDQLKDQLFKDMSLQGIFHIPVTTGPRTQSTKLQEERGFFYYYSYPDALLLESWLRHWKDG